MGLAYCNADSEGFREVDTLNIDSEAAGLRRSLRVPLVKGAGRGGTAKAGANNKLMILDKENNAMIL